MSGIHRHLALLLLAAPLLLGAAGCSSYSDPSSPAAQMAFGAEMAKKGYWSEARFRWEKALAAQPDNPRLLSNLAVAHESLGDYTAALATYKKAIALAPGDIRIQQNYARFAEFYSNYTKGKMEPGQEPKKKNDRFDSTMRVR